jgi:hypothetical protein
MAFGRLAARVVKTSGAADQPTRVERQCEEMLERVKRLHDDLSQMARRESQMRALLTRGAEVDDQPAALEDVLANSGTSIFLGRRVARLLSS